MIKKAPGGWLVDIQPGGRGSRRFRRTFTTQAEAKRYQAYIINQVTIDSDWQPSRRDTRKLSELIQLWHQHHGQHLRSDATQTLLRLAHSLGDPCIDRFSVQAFTDYRSMRLEAGVTRNTLNREHAYLRAMFNELISLGLYKQVNPLSSLRQLKVSDSELSYLTIEQTHALLESLKQSRNPHAYMVARLCLATGARWGEAQGITAERVSIEPASVQFVGTKTDKNRTLPISLSLALSVRKGRKHGRVFSPCYDAFKNGLQRAGITLPRGQATHVLRHTFASHFMQRGGNILTLQRALGHASLTTTMRYAHLAPDHLSDVLRLNPLSCVDDSLTEEAGEFRK